MCGIVGAVSQRNIVPILIEGLKRLEYRGYDSCGVAVHQSGELKRARSTSRVAELDAAVAEDAIASGTGIAHTRWATHGAPAVHNAHPHFSHGPGADANTATAGRIALVHNGIIENHEELRHELKAKGYAFTSQTDTEVIAHLVDHFYNGDLLDAVQQALARLRGAYAIAVFCRDEPQRVIGAREGSPLVLGVGEQENFLASDAMALAGVTDQIVYLEEGDVVDLQLGRYWISRRHAESGRFEAQQREVKTVHAHSGAAELGPYRHYMQKEIFEQPVAIANTLDAVTGISPRALRRRRLPHLQGGGLGPDPGLRYQLLRWLHRQVLAGEHRQDPHQRGDRQRVPLPRQRAQSAHPGRHHQPERRDRRHPGRAQACPRPGHGAHADGLQCEHQRHGA